MLESAQVDYRPTMINLTHVINIVTKELMGTIKAVSRVREALGDSPNAIAAAKKPAAPTSTGPTATADAAAVSTEAAVVGAPVVEGEGAPGAGQSAGEGGGGEAGGLLPVTQVKKLFAI